MKKGLKEILAPMSWSERLDYIWEYYKWPIIGTLFVLFVILSGINDVMNKKDVVLNIFAASLDADMEKVEELEHRLNDLIIPDDEQDDSQILLQVFHYNKTENGIIFPQGVKEKMLVEMSSQTLDVLLIPEEEFLKFQPLEDSFKDLATLLDNPIPIEEEYVITGKNQEILGIRVAAITGLHDIFPDTDLVLGIPKNSIQTENSKVFLEYFIGNSR